jgi:hypothetical protein
MISAICLYTARQARGNDRLGSAAYVFNKGDALIEVMITWHRGAAIKVLSNWLLSKQAHSELKTLYCCHLGNPVLTADIKKVSGRTFRVCASPVAVKPININLESITNA